MLVVARAVGRQADAAGGSIEQAHAQQAFEILDDGGDGGARKREAVGANGVCQGGEVVVTNAFGERTIRVAAPFCDPSVQP